MSGPSVRWWNAGAAALAASMLLAGCAVGPDFLHPAAPEDAGYTKADVATRDQVIDVLLQYPEVMERPVVFVGKKAVIARPSERVLELLD